MSNLPAGEAKSVGYSTTKENDNKYECLNLKFTGINYIFIYK